jgi:hypothetical protein
MLVGAYVRWGGGGRPGKTTSLTRSEKVDEEEEQERVRGVLDGEAALRISLCARRHLTEEDVV